MVTERKYSFEKPPAPIPESDIKETINTDIVVAGANLAQCKECALDKYYLQRKVECIHGVSVLTSIRRIDKK